MQTACDLARDEGDDDPYLRTLSVDGFPTDLTTTGAFFLTTLSSDMELWCEGVIDGVLRPFNQKAIP